MKYHDSQSGALNSVLRYKVIYLFIEWSKRVFHMILYAIAWVILRLFYSVVKARAWFEWKMGHLALVLLFLSGFPYTAFKWEKKNRFILYHI